MTFRPYSAYRPSGVPWLGYVPEHWQVVELGRVVTYRTSSVDKKKIVDELPVRLCNYTDVYYSEFLRASEQPFMSATATPHEIKRYGLVSGDVIITKDSEDWRDIGVAALVEESSEDFVCGYHLGILSPSDGVDSRFLLRVLQAKGVNAQLSVEAKGVTRYGLPKGCVKGALIPIPPMAEQKAIGQYLDRETGKIDAVIEKQKQMIERLEEYRTALISEAVTGKIDVRKSS